MRRLLAASFAAFLSLTASVGAQAQVGLRPLEGFTDAAGRPMPAVLWYPSAQPVQALRFGPFQMQAATGAVPSAGRHPLVLLSHGTGGHELAHAWIAERLAREGYVVASLRHAGDDWQDRSAAGTPGYFIDRPRQVSRLLDQLLATPASASLIDPARIAAIGHSAGGYTVLALAGAQADRERVRRHCAPGGAGEGADAAMCALGRRPAGPAAADTPADGAPLADPRIRAVVVDPRIRAVVAEAPLAQVFTPESLARVGVPVLVDYGAQDAVLAPRFHAEALCAALPRALCVRDAQAGHFAFFQAGTGPLPSAAGDPAADPPGFDRAAWQAQAAARIVAFLGQALK